MSSNDPRHDPELVPAPNRMPVWVLPAAKALMIAFDSVIAFGALALSFKLRVGGPILSDGPFAWSQVFAPYAGIAIAAIPIRLGFLAYYGAYRLKGPFSSVGEFLRITRAVLLGSLAIVTFTFLFRGGFEYREFSYSRGVFLLDLILSLLCFTLFHWVLRSIQRRVRRRDINLIPSLIVGTNREALQTIRVLSRKKDLGYRIVGVVETGRDGGGKSPEDFEESAGIPGLRVVGHLRDLNVLCRTLAIQEVIITDPGIPRETLFEILMQTDRSEKVEYKLAPSLLNYLPQKASVEQIGVLPMITLFREPLSDAERFLKRTVDLAICVSLLIVLAPVLVIAAALIKLGSPGPVMFKQERVGMDGRRFLFFKFRTMFADADENLHREAYKKNISGMANGTESNGTGSIYGKVENDPRITPIGRFLRRMSIDELPQLLNVLKGDMSIVGPRPPIPYEVEEYHGWHRERLDMKPGVTGLWQVSGRNRLSFEEMVRIDLYYIENWSFWLDIKIVMLTVPAILRGEGERDA